MESDQPPIARDKGQPAAASRRRRAGVRKPPLPILLELPDVGQFTQMALWMVGSFAGLHTPTHASQRRHFQGMARRLGWPVRGERSRGGRGSRQTPPPPDGDIAMTLLADALIGCGRAAIASVFGPPRCAVAMDQAVLSGDEVWRGRVWYYPIRQPGNDAVAIEFDEDDLARRIVFVGIA